jgi:hypothetical protein
MAPARAASDNPARSRTASCPGAAQHSRALSAAVSTVWETRRVLLERLEALADQLRKEQPIALTARDEHTARLLVGVVMLPRKHRVNKYGQCRYCAWTRRTWQFWQRRPHCTVYLSLDFAMSQPLDLVWGQLLADPKARSKPR